MVLLLGGDFRQVLPVKARGRPYEIIEICLKSSPLWNNIKKFSMTQNMRAQPEEKEFCKWLLQVGNGEATPKMEMPFKGSIEIPSCCLLNSNSSIIHKMYDGIVEEEFVNRIILTPTNEDSLKINKDILQLLPGVSKIYVSADSIITDDEEERNNYPMEFINKLTPSGMPPHLLELKLGAIVMLLRNLDLKEGLCNGTRLRVITMTHSILQCEILTGIAEGKTVLISRIDIDPSDSSGMPFKLRRRQFPLRLSYAMTINKAQGQTFNKVGILLNKPCFSHGQLYVALSRARAFGDIIVKIEKTPKQGMDKGLWYTTNVVFKQVLN